MQGHRTRNEVFDAVAAAFMTSGNHNLEEARRQPLGEWNRGRPGAYPDPPDRYNSGVIRAKAIH